MNVVNVVVEVVSVGHCCVNYRDDYSKLIENIRQMTSVEQHQVHKRAVFS